MTNGSCHSTCESKVQPDRKPWSSAARILSITVRAGGSGCRTTPESMLIARLPARVLAQLPLQEAAMAGDAAVHAVVDHNLPPGQHGGHLASDREALVVRVVHVHVVGRGGQ